MYPHLSLRRGHSRRLVLGAVAVLALAIPAAALAGGSSLKPYLVTKGEMPGFTPGQVTTAKNALQFLSGDKNKQKDAKTLASAGFERAMEEVLTTKGGRGDSDVIEMKTASGAKSLIDQALLREKDLGPGTYTKLSVPGVSSASGYEYLASKKKHGVKAREASIYWVQGRCALFAGDSRPGTKALTKPVITAVQDVAKRTHHKCP